MMKKAKIHGVSNTSASSSSGTSKGNKSPGERFKSKLVQPRTKTKKTPVVMDNNNPKKVQDRVAGRRIQRVLCLESMSRRESPKDVAGAFRKDSVNPNVITTSCAKTRGLLHERNDSVDRPWDPSISRPGQGYSFDLQDTMTTPVGMETLYNEHCTNIMTDFVKYLAMKTTYPVPPPKSIDARSDALISRNDSPTDSSIGASSETPVQFSLNDVQRSSWKFEKILSYRKLTQAKVKTCSMTDCELRACSLWRRSKRNDSPFSDITLSTRESLCYVCVDCQERCFGGWPAPEILRGKGYMSNDMIVVIATKCSKQASPEMPEPCIVGLL